MPSLDLAAMLPPHFHWIFNCKREVWTTKKIWESHRKYKDADMGKLFLFFPLKRETPADIWMWVLPIFLLYGACSLKITQDGQLWPIVFGVKTGLLELGTSH